VLVVLLCGVLVVWCAGVLEPVGHVGRAQLGARGVHTAAGEREGVCGCVAHTPGV